jgi:glutamyl-tRNA reductase
MNQNSATSLDDFFIAGLSYKNCDAVTRGKFAINNEQYLNILKLAPSYGIDNLIILSTCNRTEIYGFAKNASQLIELLCNETIGGIELFRKMAYVKKGLEAITHLYNVGCSLDSQILGDYEITGQLKKAIKVSRDHKFIGATFDRLLNSVLQSSKKIKTETLISEGLISVSFAAVKYMKEKTKFTDKHNILVLGIGKMGSNTCKNLVDYFGTTNITVINRTEEKAFELAQKLNLRFAPICELPNEVAASDIIIIATDAAEPVLLKSHLENKGNKLLIDLSIPCNVEAGSGKLPNITLVNIDQLSEIKDESLKKREAEIPKAKIIIEENIAEFLKWYEMLNQVRILKVIKSKLEVIQTQFLIAPELAYDKRSSKKDQAIQRVINSIAPKIYGANNHGCSCIEAINNFMTAAQN